MKIVIQITILAMKIVLQITIMAMKNLVLNFTFKSKVKNFYFEIQSKSL